LFPRRSPLSAKDLGKAPPDEARETERSRLLLAAARAQGLGQSVKGFTHTPGPDPPAVADLSARPDGWRPRNFPGRSWGPGGGAAAGADSTKPRAEPKVVPPRTDPDHRRPQRANPARDVSEMTFAA